MEYFIILLFCFITSITFLSTGFIINHSLLKFNFENNQIENGLIGIIFISFLALLLNFFTSLNQYINSIIFIFVVYFFYKINKNQLKKIIKFSLVVGFIGFLTFILDHSNRPDAGVYHLPYISILNDNKLIVGLVNLQFRFGHISILQYLSAIFNNIIFQDNGILIPLTILYSFVVTFFFLEIINNKNSRLIQTLAFLFFVYILTSMNRYSGFGNDDPVHMFYFLSIFYLIKNFQNSLKTSVFNKILYFSLFCFLIKQFYILALLIPFYFYIHNYQKINLFNKVSIFCFVFFLLWIIKNLLVSSCILYPINTTCVDHLKWSPKNTIHDAKKIKISSESWAKDFPNRENKELNLEEYLKSNWVNNWYKNHFDVVLKKISPLLFIIIILSFLIINKKNLQVSDSKKNLNGILLLNLIFSIIWFFKFPTFRYGASYIVSFINLSFIYIFFNNFNEENIKLKKIMIYLVVILSFLIFSKNLIRIYENYQINYVDYPWPKKNSFTKMNKKNKNLIVRDEKGIVYYKPSPFDICMYSKAPCTHMEDINVKKENFLNYYDMYYPYKVSN